MRALEAPELWEEVLAYSSNDKPIDTGTVQKFRKIFFPESEGKRRGRRSRAIDVEFDQELVLQRVAELGLKRYEISVLLDRSSNYFYDIMKRRKIVRHHIDELNDILGGEYFKVVED